jgi:hypothetical protein
MIFAISVIVFENLSPAGRSLLRTTFREENVVYKSGSFPGKLFVYPHGVREISTG